MENSMRLFWYNRSESGARKKVVAEPHADLELLTLVVGHSLGLDAHDAQRWMGVPLPGTHSSDGTPWLTATLLAGKTYFKNPPKYQILHCLRTNVVGGESLFVDTFHAAAALHPTHFEVLAKTPVPFHYISDGHHLHHAHPTIELARSPSPGYVNEIAQINYSPPYQAPLPIGIPLVQVVYARGCPRRPGTPPRLSHFLRHTTL
ncbi:taurine catabolism dioxygenase TauD, TfdA family-domain-containing protein [Mycena galopus ATCC 62051]|nr:taurine catabolism dioxygenase TauD, TfdA family-domain-containing protein [Mycena galopus ATCC 62051]